MRIKSREIICNLLVVMLVAEITGCSPAPGPGTPQSTPTRPNVDAVKNNDANAGTLTSGKPDSSGSNTEVELARDSWKQFVARCKSQIPAAEARFKTKFSGGAAEDWNLILEIQSDDLRKTDSLTSPILGELQISATESLKDGFITKLRLKVSFFWENGDWKYKACEEEVVTTTNDVDKEYVGRTLPTKQKRTFQYLTVLCGTKVGP